MEIFVEEPLATFEVKDQEQWETIRQLLLDPYGTCVIRYAARWANIMEEKIKKGARLEDIIEESSHEANIHGVITGHMYGTAAFILYLVWIHGEEVLRWHGFEDSPED